MTRQYRSRAMASIHETAEGLCAAGVMDKQTMRKFDEAADLEARIAAAYDRGYEDGWNDARDNSSED